MRHGSATQSDADGVFTADKVDRNIHLDHLVLNDTLQVDVHDDWSGRMTLYVLDDRGLAFVANLDIQDARVERLVLELPQHLVVVKT